MKFQVFGHFVVGFAGQDFVIVVLHEGCDGDVFGTAAHAIAAAGAEFVHILRDVLTDPLEVFL